MRADLFCRVIDNYGDIGVCWRLARRLAHGHGWRLRLWVDDLASFARIQPGVQPGLPRQAVDGVEILHWTPETPLPEPGDVVIEAFACDPPAQFVASMRQRRPLWINLEYLSAEAWVESCHGLPSQRADGLVKYFFFPGYTSGTGGLLREPGLSAERDALQASPAARRTWLQRLGLTPAQLAPLDAGARLVSLFCYPHAPWVELAAALAAGPRPTLLLAPSGIAPGLEAACPPDSALTLARVPFVAQPDYDRLLWCCDLNFVRGEDSLVRAGWAARPLVWQIYPQDEDAHLPKLEAWLERYGAPPAAEALIRAWNRSGDAPLGTALAQALHEPAWGRWAAHARAWDAELAGRPDLADRLVAFCTARPNPG
ncbi:elongation factor P maturation arginine rhamnosyltransferase EarP [Bordetella sp. 2513F-2]